MVDEGTTDGTGQIHRLNRSGRVERRRSDVTSAAILAIAVSDDAGLDQAIGVALADIAGHERADRAYITDFRTDGTFETIHEWTAAGVESHRPAIRKVPQTAFAWSVSEARAGRFVAVEELSQLPVEAAALAESFGAFGVRSLLEVPIFLDGQLRWVIGLNRIHTPAPWSHETVESLRRVGDVIGRGLTRRAAVDELRAARDRAERAARTADAFLSQMGHELRTPLHAILGFAELIDTRGDPSSDAAVDQITQSGRHLLGLLESLLDLVPITAGNEASVARRAPIGTMVRDALADLGAPTETSSVEIALDDESESLVVDVDAVYVEGIIRCMVRGVVSADTRSLRVRVLPGDGFIGLAIVADGSDWVPDLHRGFPISRALLAGLGGRLLFREPDDDGAPAVIAWVPSTTVGSVSADGPTGQPESP